MPSEQECESSFNYCDKIELHALDLFAPLSSVVAVCGEHGFRGILVPLGRIEELVKCINRPDIGSKAIIPIAVLDYPFGLSTQDVRSYSIISAKEKGAKEVEIVAPYHHIVNQDSVKLIDDVKSLVSTAKKVDIGLRYVIDQNCEFLDDSFKTKMCRILAQAKINKISVSMGFFDYKVDHGDNIIKMRNLKSKTNSQVKIYLDTDDPSEMALYPRAGADIIGLDWDMAAFLTHGYESIISKKE